MDLKVAFRSLFKNPGFAVLAIVVLALGIGANTAIFSVINAVLLRPLPYENPERIVALQNYYPQRARFGTVSAPDFRDWESQSTSFSATSMYSGWPTSVVAIGHAEGATVTRFTRGLFDVFEVKPVLGRLLTPEEHRKGGPADTVISYSLWQRSYQGDSGVIGKQIKADDRLYTIVGVLPAGFGFPDNTDAWIPYEPSSDGTEDRTAHNFEAVGRLKPDVSLEQAQAEMSGIGARLAKQYATNANKTVALTRMQDEMVRNVRTTLYLLMGAVALVLIIACGNVANLLLTRVMQRKTEMAIRAAIGATRTDIVAQLAAESLVLAIPAALVGVLLGGWGAAVVSKMAA
jgi:putative ABC transport system permease protein